MRHTYMNGGLRQMDIDHFNPTLKKAARNAYANLMLAAHSCNMMKKAFWAVPTRDARSVALLNPCKELDYGQHIFEHPDTHMLVGVTARGRQQIDVLDLNNETFVRERATRSEYRRLRKTAPSLLRGSFAEMRAALQFVKDQLELLIPEIPAPPVRVRWK